MSLWSKIFEKAQQEVQPLTEEYESAHYRSSLAEIRLTKAKILAKQGETDVAHREVQLAIDVFERYFAARPLLMFKTPLAVAWMTKGEIYGEDEDWIQAAGAAQTAVKYQQEIVNEMPDSNRQLKRLETFRKRLERVPVQTGSNGGVAYNGMMITSSGSPASVFSPPPFVTVTSIPSPGRRERTQQRRPFTMTVLQRS